MQVRTRYKLLLIILGVAALLFALALTLPPREPTYKGLTAEQWDARRADPERAEAFRILGTNNLRLFTQRLAYDPKKDKPLLLYNHLPSWMRNRAWLANFVSRKNARAFSAQAVLYTLGPQAAPELPRLLQIAKDGDLMVAMRVVGALRNMGEPACPVFIALTAHQNPALATVALKCLGPYTNSPAVHQALTNALHDPRPVVRTTAEAALMGRLDR